MALTERVHSDGAISPGQKYFLLMTFHRHQALCRMYSSLVLVHDLAHYNTACIGHLSLSTYIYMFNLAAESTPAQSEEHPDTVIEGTYRYTWRSL